MVTESGEPIGEVTAVDGDDGATRLVVRSRRNEVLIPLADEICTVDLDGEAHYGAAAGGSAGAERGVALARRSGARPGIDA